MKQVVQSPESENQQEEKNIVDERKNIMNNRYASTKHSISNNYKGGEMGNGNKNKSIEEKLSGAINSIDSDTVGRLLDQEDTNITESILKEALDQAKKRIANLKEGDKKQDQKDRLTQIIELLETKLKSISARTTELPVGDNVEDVVATTSSQSASVISGDGEEKQSPDQPTEHTILQADGKQESESKDDQPDSPSHSSESSTDGNGHSSSSSSFVNVSESNESVTDSSNGEYVKVSSGSGSDSSSEEVGKDKNVFTLKSSSPQDIQPGISTSKPSGTGAEGDKKKQTPAQPAKDIAQIDDEDDYDLSWLFSEEGDQIPHPESEPIPSLTNKKPEQVNNTTPQDTKSSNLHIIAASALAVAGVILGVAIAVHLEMLVVGILVGACCLVAAAVMYHYEWPSSFIETNKVEKVAPNEKKEPVATSV